MTPDGWRPVGLPDVASLEMGETLIAKDLTGEGIPVFSAGRDPAPWGYTSHGKKRFKRGTIVLGARGTIGFPRLPPFETFVSTQTTIAVTPFDGTYPAFLKYALDAQNFDAITAKQAIPMLTIGALRDMQLLLPPPAEQRKIAAILSSVDESIQAAQAVIDELQFVKQAMMADLLTRGLPGKHTRFKETDIGEVPAEWGLARLGEIADVTKLAGFEFTKHVKYADDGEIIAIRALNIKRERLDLSDVQRISREVSDQLPRSKVRAGDVLITYIGANIGELLLVEEDDKYHLAPNVARVAATGSIAPSLLVHILRSPYVQSQMRGRTATTATPSLTMEQIRALKLAFPTDAEEQDLLARALQSISERWFVEKDRLLALRAAKEALMSVLLTGEVRVKRDEEAA